MTTAAAEPSYSLVELSEEDKIKNMEELEKILDDPNTLKKFVEGCKNIGRTADAIDKDFIHVKDGFDKLVKDYETNFPELGSKYVPDWVALMARWQGETGLFWSSKELAAKTAATLTDYGINLQLVAEIASEQDLKDAQAELKNYVDKHPVTIAKKVEDGFKNLSYDIGKFSTDFTDYLEKKNQDLTKEADGYKKEIDKYQGEVNSINKKINDTLIGLYCTGVFGVIALAFDIGFLWHYFDERGEAQNNLDKAKANLKRVQDEQKVLAKLDADFQQIKPYIDDICTKLGIFAMIWSFMTEQCDEIKTALDDGMAILTTKLFQLHLANLRKQIEPLKEGKRTYATPGE